MIKKLWHSTAQLHARFDIKPLPAPVRRVFQEEAREVLEAAKVIDAVLKSETRTIDDLVAPREHLAEEVIDTLVTLCALCQAYGITRRQLSHAASQVIKKNAAKTLDTHEINRAGKIARRQPE